MTTERTNGASSPSASSAELERFEAWWQAHGQYCRAGGGEYEKTFSFRAWEAAEKLEREACKEACRKIAAQYPADIWPENGESLDCKSARMARLTAANCEREIDMRSNDPR